MRVAIVQSNYIPWKGYFDLIGLSDHFVLLDEVQYTPRDWRNRNKIKTPRGTEWLTIPVQTKGKQRQRIDETLIEGTAWAETHWKSIAQNYAKAPYFADYRAIIEPLYRNARDIHLSDINRKFLETLCGLLGLKTKISWSTDHPHAEGKTERLLNLCTHLGATEYLSGPAANDYLDENLFKKEGIAVRWMDYAGYPEYRQLHPPFAHDVSVLDLIFNEGPAAPKFMKCFGARAGGKP